MSNAFRRWSVGSLLLCVVSALAGPVAKGQSTGSTGLDKQLSRIDFALSGIGEFTSTVSGVEKRDAGTASPITIQQSQSETFGVLVSLRYIKSPYMGFEGNYSYARYVQDYTTFIPGGVQANTHEYSVGYVAHPPAFFTLQPYVGAGIGTIEYKPTPNGGEGLSTQARALYYYTAGVDEYFPSSHLGLRAGFRQYISLAPDFEQNYLTITRRAITSEPQVGVFLRF